MPIQVGIHPSKVVYFKPGVLDKVRSLGGQFAEARMTIAPTNVTEIVESADGVLVPIQSTPSATQVIYLPKLVEGSRNCIFDPMIGDLEDGQTSVSKILGELPKVEGVCWTVGSVSIIGAILTNHLVETGECLLSDAYSWTTSPSFMGPSELTVVGEFSKDSSIRVETHTIYLSQEAIGLFLIGVPG